MLKLHNCTGSYVYCKVQAKYCIWRNGEWRPLMQSTPPSPCQLPPISVPIKVSIHIPQLKFRTPPPKKASSQA